MTALFGCCIAGATWNCCRRGASSVCTIQPCISLQRHFIQSHIGRVYVCLAVTCHLLFWQNDRDLLRATAVTRGWNGYRNKSQHRKLTLEKNIFPRILPGNDLQTFRWRVLSSTTELCSLENYSNPRFRDVGPIPAWKEKKSARSDYSYTQFVSRLLFKDELFKNTLFYIVGSALDDFESAPLYGFRLWKCVLPDDAKQRTNADWPPTSFQDGVV